MNAFERVTHLDAHELGRREGLAPAAAYLRGEAARFRASTDTRLDLRTRARLVDHFTRAAAKVVKLK